MNMFISYAIHIKCKNNHWKINNLQNVSVLNLECE